MSDERQEPAMIADHPVAVLLPAPLEQQVVAWVERDLGWQVVDPGGSLPPALALSDRACGELPWIAVTAGPPSDDRVNGLLTAGAEDVVGWPDDRDRIPLVATRVDLHRQVSPQGATLAVAGASGGAGTSTVALAIGGLLAWAGAAVLVVGGDALLSLAGVEPRTAGAHTPVAGVPGLSVAGRRAGIGTVAWSGDVVVVDAGTRVTPGTTVIVARADGGLRRARVAERPVIVIGDVPLGRRAAERALGRPALVHLPLSLRVARAGLYGRVPSSLPGRWLDDLGSALRRLERSST